MTQNLVALRAVITERSIRKWFEEIRGYFDGNSLMDVLKDPRRTFNADETAFYVLSSYVLRQGWAKFNVQ